VSRPLRIVHVYNWLDPANGGPPRVIVGLAAGQRALGHDVRLISSDRPGGAADRFVAAHLDPPPPRATVRPKFFVPLLTRRRLTAALADADVAHLHGIWPPVTLLASRICRSLGVPYVLAPHGSLHAGALAEKWPRKHAGLWLLGYAGLVRHAAALHLLNPDEARIPGFVPRPARTEIVPNGVFTAPFDGLGPVASGGPAVVLFLGRLHPAKGCGVLGEAFGRLARRDPDARLVAVGPDQGGAAILRAAARRHGFADRLALPGPLFDAEKAAALGEATVFCLPSRHEGFSIATLEAMAARRPVVISEACHFPEVADAGAGRVVPLEAGAIADALGAVIGDRVAAAAMGARGRALVERHYRWASIAQRTVDLYRSVHTRADEAPR